MSKNDTADPNHKGNKRTYWLQPTHRFAPYLYIGIVFAVVAAYYLITIAIVTWWANEKSTLSPGTFGDTFGAINALFTGVAFAGFLISLALQRKDLKNQKKQLKLQRKDLKSQTEQLALQTTELEAQKEEMKRTREEMELQRNESNLFSLLDAHKRLIDSLTYSPQTLNDEDGVLGQAFFNRRPGDSYNAYNLTGAQLLKYVVGEAERIKEKRQKAFETKFVEHYSCLLGGPKDLSRIFLIATGIDESDRLITDFIREKFGSSADFYMRIYLNSLSKNERILRILRDGKVDLPDLPLLKLFFQGIRLGWQGHPESDGFIVIEAQGDWTFIKSTSTDIVMNYAHINDHIKPWKPVVYEGEQRILMPVYPKKLILELIFKTQPSAQSNNVFIISVDYTVRICSGGKEFSVKIDLNIDVYETLDKGISFGFKEAS